MARSILVPMDESPPSKAALIHALSTHPTAAITVLHVIDTTKALGYGEGVVPPVPGGFAEDRADELFVEARDLAEEHGVDITTVVERGSPARTIIAYVEDHEIDQIVMGSHGRQGVARLIFGSVAERVVRRAPIPVTVVR